MRHPTKHPDKHHRCPCFFSHRRRRGWNVSANLKHWFLFFLWVLWYFWSKLLYNVVLFSVQHSESVYIHIHTYIYIYMYVYIYPCYRKKPLLTPRWNCFCDLLSVAFVIIITHNGGPQRILPLCLTIKPNCFCSFSTLSSKWMAGRD